MRIGELRPSMTEAPLYQPKLILLGKEKKGTGSPEQTFRRQRLMKHKAVYCDEFCVRIGIEPIRDHLTCNSGRCRFGLWCKVNPYFNVRIQTCKWLKFWIYTVWNSICITFHIISHSIEVLLCKHIQESPLFKHLYACLLYFEYCMDLWLPSCEFWYSETEKSAKESTDIHTFELTICQSELLGHLKYTSSEGGVGSTNVIHQHQYGDVKGGRTSLPERSGEHFFLCILTGDFEKPPNISVVSIKGGIPSPLSPAPPQHSHQRSSGISQKCL